MDLSSNTASITGSSNEGARPRATDRHSGEQRRRRSTRKVRRSRSRRQRRADPVELQHIGRSHGALSAIDECGGTRCGCQRGLHCGISANTGHGRLRRHEDVRALLYRSTLAGVQGNRGAGVGVASRRDGDGVLRANRRGVPHRWQADAQAGGRHPMAALDKSNPTIVSGWRNALLSTGYRFIPRRVMVQISEQLLKAN